MSDEEALLPEIDPASLVFLPLGGTGEIGMNLNLYGFGGKWLIVDMGVSFADDTTPGVDVFMADPAFIAERADDIVGLVLTHGHEDHLGAVGHLWPRLRCPVYATAFTAGLLRHKLAEAGLEREVDLHVLAARSSTRIGPFTVELVNQTHSIPEAQSLAIKTPVGVVVHTGDWKFDPKPLIGALADKDAMRRLGDKGVLAVVGDSTNVFTAGKSGSEAEVRESLVELFGRYRRRIVLACFATNVARVESVAIAAKRNGRHVALCGRSLRRIDEVAREAGYLAGLPPFLSEEEGGKLPPDKVVILCTGSQGEPRAALSRIAQAAHPHVALEAGDVAVFSSRIIPGNERSIFRLQNRLVKMGVEVVTEKDHFVHVSGHPGSQEMREFYSLLRPAYVVPVHGEARHLLEHAELAQECGARGAPVIENGDILRLGPGEPEVIGQVPTGRLALDGNRLVPMDSDLLRNRQRMMLNGGAVVTLVMDRMGRILGEPQVSALGLLEDGEEADGREDVLIAVRDAVEEMPLAARQNDEIVRETVRIAVRRQLRRSHGKKPLTDVHLVRI